MNIALETVIDNIHIHAAHCILDNEALTTESYDYNNYVWRRRLIIYQHNTESSVYDHFAKSGKYFIIDI
jgi:hypothetical protein